MNRLLIVMLLTAWCHTLQAGDEKRIIASSLKSATVYRSGAELTHTAKSFLEQGNNELVIEGLSSRIELNSLQIGSSSSITILSMEFSTDYLRVATKSPIVKKLEDSLEVLAEELDRIQTSLKTDQELLDLLKSNKQIAGSQSGLSVAELTKMVDYYKTKAQELNQEISHLKTKEQKIINLHAKVSAQKKEEEQKNNKTSGKLMLQIYSPVSVQVDFTVSYITPLAWWTPDYDLRVDNISQPMRLSYKARLVQTSGIDWNQVKLALSTSVPSQKNNAPALKTWFLSYVTPSYANFEKQLDGRLAGVSASRDASLSEVVVVGYGTSRRSEISDEPEVTEPLYFVNDREVKAEEYRKIEKRAFKTSKTYNSSEAVKIYGRRAGAGAIVVTLKDELGDYVNIQDNQLNVVFDIELPYDVPSNGKEQSVVLKDFRVPVTYNFFTAPNMDKDAYLLGDLPDWEQLNLLPGEANIIFEGTYIGKTKIDPASTEDTLHLTLGRDKRVVVTRELLKDFSSVKFLGSNKKQVFTYEITVKNNKKEKIQMTLKDQYPLSTNKDIEVELLQHDNAQINEETGVLTWKLELAPGEIKKYKLSYSVKFPKEKRVNL